MHLSTTHLHELVVQRGTVPRSSKFICLQDMMLHVCDEQISGQDRLDLARLPEM